MNREEILVMEVGSKLDILVAQEVFGIEVEWDYSLWDVNKVFPKQPFIKDEPRTILGPMAHSVANIILPYSTDISAAWQVVEEKMSVLGLSVKYGQQLYQLVVSESIINGDMFMLAHARPELRCKAALLTMLEKG